MENKEKTCFVIMPISDVEGYDMGHFKRVYEYIIKPACINAGFIPIRADDVNKTNVIVIDILQKLLNSEMSICDLSGRNPNVLYELGIRQAFDLPVTFIKDEITTRIFDIQSFRDLEYNSNLRVDEVNGAIEKLTQNIEETYRAKGNDVNSIVELLSISKAKINQPVEISKDTDIILKSLHDLSLRIGSIESKINMTVKEGPVTQQKHNPVDFFNKDGVKYVVGDRVNHSNFGFGSILTIDRDDTNNVRVTIDFDDVAIGRKYLMIKFATISKVVL